MKPTSQCERAAKSANMALGMILRSFHYRSKDTLIPLYKTFVRPRMEFAVASWAPWTEKEKSVLEAVQRRMVRALSDVVGATYEERLADAGLSTLDERRKRGDVIEVFKTLHGFNRVDRNSWFDIRDKPEQPLTRNTRANTTVTNNKENRRRHVLYKPPARGEIRNNFFTVRVIRQWNDLPDEVKNQKTVNGFKTAYDRWKKTTQETNEGTN